MRRRRRGLDEGMPVLAALADRVRLAAYLAVRARHGPVTRAEVAADLGISPKLAAFHLDKLEEAGLLASDYKRAPGRGRGGGRPAKRYVAGDVEVDVSIPPRRHDVLASILVAGAAGEDVFEAARAHGRELGAAATGRSARRKLLAALEALGYEPNDGAGGGEVVLPNCPFAAAESPAMLLVCRVNHALVQGVLEGQRLPPDRARLDPDPGRRCCVVLAAG